MAIPTNGLQLVRIAGAVFNQQLSAADYSEILTANKTAADLNAWANAATAAEFKGKTTTDISKAVLANLGLTQPGLEAWLAGQLTAGGGVAKAGETMLGLLNDFSNMTADATFGSFATTFNNKAASSQALSQTAGTATGTYAAVSSVVVNTALTLTSAAQTSTGTAGDDTFTAAAGTWGTSDIVNGGAGTDTLNATITGTGPTQSATSLVSVEVLNLTPSPNPATLDLTGVTGLTQVNNLNPANGASLAVTGVGNVVNTAITGGNTSTTLTYATAAVAGTADASTLTLNGVAAGSTFVTSGVETLTVNSATSANTLTTLTDTGITRLNITGSQALTVSNAVGSTTIATVDASASTGALTLTTGAGAGGTAATGVTFTAGSGATTITTGANNDTVTLGAGAGTVVTGLGNDTITSGAGANTITPGGGNDTLTLGAGVDTVRFAEAGATSSDVINGFATGDIISLNLGTAAVAATSTTAATAATAAFMGVIQTGTTTPGFAGVAGTGSASTISFQAVSPNATVANTVLPASNVLALNGVLTDGTASGLVNALGTTATGVAISTAANSRFVIVAYTAGNVAQLWQYAGDGVGGTQNGSTAAVDARIQSAELNLMATLNNVAPNSLTAASFNTYLGTSTVAPTVSNTGQTISLTGTLNTVSTTTNAQGQFMTAANDTVSVGLGTTPSAAASSTAALTVLDSSTTDSDTLNATVLAPGWNLGSTFTNLENVNLTMTVADTDGWAMTTVMPGTTNLGVLGAQNVGTLGASGAASSTGITGIVSGTAFTLGAAYTGTLVASNATVIPALTLNLAGTAGTSAATSPTFNAVTPTADAAAITALTVNVQANTTLNADSQTAVTPTSTSAFSAGSTTVQGSGNLSLYGTAAQLNGSTINASGAAYTGALTLLPTSNASMNFGDASAVTGIRTIDLTGVSSFNNTITLSAANNSAAYGTGAVTVNFAPTSSSALGGTGGVTIAQLGAGQTNAITLALGSNATNVTGGINVATGINTLAITHAAPSTVTTAPNLNGVTMSSGAGTQAATITAASAVGITVGTFTGDSLNTTGVTGTVSVTLANGSLGSTFVGGNGANTVTGAAGPDSITTGSAADVITLTSGGSDIVSSGAGNDTITTTNTTTSAIVVDGGAGTDTLVFNNAAATSVTAMTGIEQILLTAQTAGANVNTQAGNAAIPSSAVSSALGINVTAAGAFGLTVNMDTNSVNLTQANITTAFTDAGGTGRTAPTAADSRFTIVGTGLNDTITGGSATINFFTGGVGADSMTGGSAVDTYIIAQADSNTTAGIDRITSFTAGTDVLDLATAAQGTVNVASGNADVSNDSPAVASTGTTATTLLANLQTAATALIAARANSFANTGDTFSVQITGASLAGTDVFYVVQNAAADGNVTSADTVIALIGLTSAAITVATIV